MTKQTTTPPQITVYYTKNEYYKLFPVTGAHGGITPSGDIILDFFVERQPFPEKLILELEGGQPKEIKREGGKDLIREMQAGVLLRADIAHKIGKWLLEKAAQAGFTEIKQ